MPAARRRATKRSRISPALHRPSRARVGLVSAAAFAVAGLLVTTVARGRVEATIELDPSGPYRLHSSAGPIEVSTGSSARLDYRASWLGHRPELASPPAQRAPLLDNAEAPRRPQTALELSCDTRLPCRALARLELPPAATLEAGASGGPVLVDGFDGDLVVTTTDDHEVIMGPVSGTIRVETDGGDVTGHGLAARRVEITTREGEIGLDFRVRPRSVTVAAGRAPVAIVLPPGPYAVTVVGSSSTSIEVDQDETAESRISIEGRGPVRIADAPPP